MWARKGSPRVQSKSRRERTTATTFHVSRVHPFDLPIDPATILAISLLQGYTNQSIYRNRSALTK
jgi:hypothetical protein